MPETVHFKLPEAFIARMRSRLGSESDAFFRSLEEASPVSIRINPRRWNHQIQLKPVPWTRFGYYLPERPSFTLDPLFHAGAYYVQEPGSMFLEQAFQAIPVEGPRLVLDLCGAPGGKSTHLLSMLNDDDFLVSNEVIRSRAVILQENIQKWGYSNVIVTQNDPKDFSSLGELFDLIVVDAPCSGEGLFRKDPSSVSEWSENNTQLCSARQKRILAQAWECLKPGGHIIYSTCTYNPDENEENLAWLRDQFDAIPVSIQVSSAWNVHQIKLPGMEAYQLFPHQAISEGFFLGIIRKAGFSTDRRTNDALPKKWFPSDIAVSKVLADWITGSDKSEFLEMRDQIVYLPKAFHAVLARLSKGLNILQAGIQVASAKGNQLNPHAALAHAVCLNRAAFPETDLTLFDALRYLQRENIHAGDTSIGWVLMTYRGMALGWAKNIGQRTNNYFPKERRIRMQIGEIPVPWYDR